MHPPSGVLFRLFDADRILARARRHGARRFATAWVRGLGDVPFILGEFVRYVGTVVPGAEVSLLVRPGIRDACRWIEGVHDVVGVDEWRRERTLTSLWGPAYPPPWEIRRALARRGLERAFDAVLPYPLGRWYERGAPARRPALRWTEAERRFGREFVDRAVPDRPRFVIALNAWIGTSRYYPGDKEWGIDRFARLVAMVLEAMPDARFILTDGDKVDGLPQDPRVVDVRGALGVAESTAVIAASDLFIGLDAGPANLLYFLRDIALDLVVLLGRTDRFTPLRYPPAGSGVRLTTIRGEGEDIHTITPETVLDVMRSIRAHRTTAWR
jgi:ADP-heptose:LPS heptosyltransferase